jgi:hypothetical protein
LEDAVIDASQTEKHFPATETVRDVVFGMADGLTVSFGLAAGLVAAVSSTKVIVTAGLTEIVAGASAMGRAQNEQEGLNGVTNEATNTSGRAHGDGSPEGYTQHRLLDTRSARTGSGNPQNRERNE